MAGNKVRVNTSQQFARLFHPTPHVVNALLVQSRGDHAETICENCSKGQRNFEKCLKVRGVFAGGCGNCTAQGVQTRCTARDPEEEESAGEEEEEEEEDEEEDGEEGEDGDAENEEEDSATVQVAIGCEEFPPWFGKENPFETVVTHCRYLGEHYGVLPVISITSQIWLMNAIRGSAV